MRYKIIGLSKDMGSVFIFKKQEDGSKVFAQRPIKRGISFEIDEEEMSFHVKRLEVRKVLRTVPIEEAPVIIAEPKLSPVILEPKIEVKEEAPVIEVIEEVEEKKSYKPRKKKKIFDDDKT